MAILLSQRIMRSANFTDSLKRHFFALLNLEPTVQQIKSIIENCLFIETRLFNFRRQ